MQDKVLQIASEAGRNALSQAKQFNDVNSRVVEKVIGQQFKMATDAVEFSIEQSTTLGNLNSFEAMLKAQANLFEAGTRRGMENTRAWMDILNESRDAYLALAKDANPLKSAVKRASSAARKAA